MDTPTHFLLFFSKPLGILDTEGKKKIIIISIREFLLRHTVVTLEALQNFYI